MTGSSVAGVSVGSLAIASVYRGESSEVKTKPPLFLFGGMFLQGRGGAKRVSN